MTDDMATAGYYDAAVAAGAPAKTAANWVLGDLTAHCKVLHVPAVLWWRVPCRPGSACMQMDFCSNSKARLARVPTCQHLCPDGGLGAQGPGGKAACNAVLVYADASHWWVLRHG